MLMLVLMLACVHTLTFVFLCTPQNIGCNPFCVVKWNGEVLGETSKQPKTFNPIWADNTQTLKWASSVLDAVPYGDNAPVRVTKNQQYAVNQQGGAENTSLPEQVAKVMERFGQYIDSNNYKKEELFQAMDCEQNGLIGKAELVKYFKEEAKFDMTEEDADALMQHLDEDGNDVIDLGELELLVRISLAAYKRKQATAGLDNIVEEQPKLVESASAPVVMPSPRAKLDEAKKLDAEINA